jgi:hypothetical protein
MTSYEMGQAGEMPSWWRSSPKSSARIRYRAAPYSFVAPPTK